LLIAIVDDDAAVRRALERVLRAGGYCVTSHCSGEELLKSLGSSQPDCIVLDVHMPDFDGFEVQAALARGGWTIPVVVITGHYDARARSRATALGAVACLPKPVESATLLEAIEGGITGRGVAGS
jgi:two-component system, LuxR family, response regulator FixJ